MIGIVASYPFALGMILGFVSLLLIFFTNEKQRPNGFEHQEVPYQRNGFNDRFNHAS
jgi:hypothetical protein